MKTTTAAQDTVFIVAWNDHFFVLRICSPDLVYLVDTLGVRLYDGCDKAFIVRFETDAEDTATGKCKAFSQSILAVETLDEVSNNLSALELSGEDQKKKEEGENQGKEESPKEGAEDEAENLPCSHEGVMGWEWQFLLGMLQLELQYVS